jgi:hypothetical protein
MWLLFPLACIATLLSQKNSFAQGTLFTSRSSFNAALSSSSTITFESLAPSSPSSTGVSPINVSGVSFANASARLFITSTNTGLYPIPGTGQYLWNFDSGTPIAVTLPTGRNSFAADFSGGIVQNNPFNATITFNLADGGTYTHHFVGHLGEWSFVGFVFPQAITSLVYDDGGIPIPGDHEEMLDNVTFGIGAVPEPNSSVLVTFGILGLLVARHLGRARHDLLVHKR